MNLNLLKCSDFSKWKSFSRHLTLKNHTQLVCAGVQEPGADAIRTRHFPGPVLFQGLPHLVCCKEQAGAGGIDRGGGYSRGDWAGGGLCA